MLTGHEGTAVALSPVSRTKYQFTQSDRFTASCRSPPVDYTATRRPGVREVLNASSPIVEDLTAYQML